MSSKKPKPARGRPATGETPKRYFRMSDGDWQEVQDAAEASGKTVSEFVRETLLKAAKRKN